MKSIKFFMLIFALIVLALFTASCSGDTKIIKVDYENMTYVGTSLKNFSALFDEQDTLDPLCYPNSEAKNGLNMLDYDANGEINEIDKNASFEFTVDLGSKHRVKYIYAYFESEGCGLTVETGTPFAYEKEFKLDASREKWNLIEVNKKTRYVNLTIQNGKAPSEIVIYGYQTGKEDKINTEPHNYKTMDYFLGINGNTNDIDKYERISCANYFRDYVNWAWCYDHENYPNAGTQFATGFAAGCDGNYLTLRSLKIGAAPCYMFGSEVAIPGIDKSLPEAYAMYGELLYQVSVRYGNNTMNTTEMVCLSNPRAPKRFNLDRLDWIEAGNEPNGEGNDGFTPYELAALTSVAYDGHCKTVTAPSGSGVGVKNADPNMQMAMAGLAGVGTRYIKAMTFWMEHNRKDGKIAMDAFNVHTYCRKTVTYNGYTFSYGVCPEAGDITGEIKKLASFRDKYYPDTELWLTEFGWDTNQSYETENACHAYGEFTARELQAMWLVRAYFMFASVGVDRCAMYMCSDLGDEETSVGKYGTSGIVTSNGEYKDSYYYIYTIKNTMGDMYFKEIIDSGNENVWIYRFENGKGKSCYALWCPTMDSVEVHDYKLSIDGDNATMVEFANKETSGISTTLTVNNKTATVDVSERPVLIFSE